MSGLDCWLRLFVAFFTRLYYFERFKFCRPVSFGSMPVSNETNSNIGLGVLALKNCLDHGPGCWSLSVKCLLCPAFLLPFCFARLFFVCFFSVSKLGRPGIFLQYLYLLFLQSWCGCCFKTSCFKRRYRLRVCHTMY